MFKKVMLRSWECHSLSTSLQISWNQVQFAHENVIGYLNNHQKPSSDPHLFPQYTHWNKQLEWWSIEIGHYTHTTERKYLHHTTVSCMRNVIFVYSIMSRSPLWLMEWMRIGRLFTCFQTVPPKVEVVRWWKKQFCSVEKAVILKARMGGRPRWGTQALCRALRWTKSIKKSPMGQVWAFSSHIYYRTGIIAFWKKNSTFLTWSCVVFKSGPLNIWQV